MKTNTAHSVALAAAFAGLLEGTAARLNAQPASTNSTVNAASGFLLVQDKPLPKHACAGQNDCKGHGGGKDAGKNDCKGKGGCATDGSHHAPKAS